MSCRHTPRRCTVPDAHPCTCEPEPAPRTVDWDTYMRTARALNWRTAQLQAHGIEPLKLNDECDQYPPIDLDWKAPHPLHKPCGYSEPESDYRDPDTGKHRTARCEGPKGLIIRGNGVDSVTDGHMWIGARRCPNGDK